MTKSHNKLPKSALALYVKLYCKKKKIISRNKQNDFVEATKSWVSLGKADKQYFLKTFKEYESKLQKKIALRLQNAKPYLMKKHGNIKRTCKIKEDLTTPLKNESPDCPPCIENEMAIEPSSSVNNDIEQGNEESKNPNTIVHYESVHSIDEPDISKVISEPPPPLRSSKELFEIIKNNDTSTEHVNWIDLSKSHKRRYQRALLTIKYDYIKHYTAYLETLSPEDLYYYYKSKC